MKANEKRSGYPQKLENQNFFEVTKIRVWGLRKLNVCVSVCMGYKKKYWREGINEYQIGMGAEGF